MSHLTFGVDIGGTSVKLGVVDLAATSSSQRILFESNFPTPSGDSKVMAEAVARSIVQLKSAYTEVDRLGVGVPGAMNADRSLVRYPPNLIGWKEEPLAQHLREYLPQFSQIEVDNDAKVATLAEARLGAGIGVPFFLLVTLGTGVGGGIYYTDRQNPNGAIFRGASGGAGEFGHISIDYNGPQCNCGAKGCIEAYIGQRYLSQRTLEKLRQSNIQSLLRGNLTTGELNPREIDDAMNAGDEFARGVILETGMLLGVAMANVAKLLDIHIFIVGGGVAQAGEVLLNAARVSLRANVFENQRALVEVRPATLGNKAGIIGAALLVS